jgi:uncharacterized protein (UPF0261 family)/ABC-type branched-subunit amino acid transport system ATPase component
MGADMAERYAAAAPRNAAPPRGAQPMLQIRGLNVFYGNSHALQGVELTLDHGVLSVVGRNGMGKTTLCKTIMGLVRASSGTIRMAGTELTGRSPADVARAGVGYVPQGRRLWPSLTVDEHLRMTAAGHAGSWSVERVYDTFPRLAERKTNRGGQLSGGEQQMVAISRALLLNPRLLVMDEPTEGLAPVIVNQVEEMLIRLGQDGEMSILVIEQNIGVACAIADKVAIMVNGRINRTVDAALLAADRDLQQRLLGVGRHGHEAEDLTPTPGVAPVTKDQPARMPSGPVRIYVSNPNPPTRWSQPVPVARIEAAARTTSGSTAEPARRDTVELRPVAVSGDPYVIVAGTLDTKGAELRFIRDLLKEQGVRTRLVDLSTSGKMSSADVTPLEVAMNHRRGANAVMGTDRGECVSAMADAFEIWVRRQQGIAGIIAAGGSGGTSIVAPAMRALPVGVPKIMISTVASGDVARYVGPSDIMMMYSVTDVAGLNAISRQVLANGAQAMAGMVQARAAILKDVRGRATARPELPAIGLTMFGVTTPSVEHMTGLLKDDFDCLVFHATGVGGRSMEKLVESGMLAGVIDVTTTEIADLLMGGVMAATEDRFGAMIRARMPYVGSVGALDMVNFGARDTVPSRYEGRLFYQHNPQVTLMRTTPEENERMGRFIGEKLNQMDAPVRFFLPEGGISALDAPGRAFHNPDAMAALFGALERTVRQTSSRRLIRVPHHINDPLFARAVVEAFRAITIVRQPRRKATR